MSLFSPKDRHPPLPQQLQDCLPKITHPKLENWSSPHKIQDHSLCSRSSRLLRAPLCHLHQLTCLQSRSFNKRLRTQELSFCPRISPLTSSPPSQTPPRRISSRQPSRKMIFPHNQGAEQRPTSPPSLMRTTLTSTAERSLHS